MVPQVAPNAGPIGYRFNTGVAQVRAGSYAGAHEDCWRVDGAGGQNDFPGRHVATVFEFHAASSSLFEDDAPHAGVTQNRQVRAPSNRCIQVRHRCRGSSVRGAADRYGCGAVSISVLGVDVSDSRNAASLQGLAQRERKRAPLAFGYASDLNRTVVPVEGTGKIGVRLELFEIRQDVAPAPTLYSQRAPLIVVSGEAALCMQAIDCGSSTDHPA